MSGGLKTTGDMRSFLLETMEGVRNGSVKTETADRIAKLAGQVTASLTAEAQMALVQQKGRHGVGSLPLGGVTEARAELPAPTVSALPVANGEHIFCEQCDKRVTTSQAVACKSQFCKAKAAA